MDTCGRKTWKLSAEQKREMGSRYVAGDAVCALARDYGLRDGGVRYVLRRLGITLRPTRQTGQLRADEIPAALAACLDLARQEMRPYGDHLRLCVERTCARCARKDWLSVAGLRAHWSRATGLCQACHNRTQPRQRRGARHPRWRGGRSTENGYVMIYAPEHPFVPARGYMLEHRLVMERMLGRYLAAGETVHHKNGVRDDNRPENLELWTRAQPAGVRSAEAPHCPTCTCHLHHVAAPEAEST